MAKFDRKYRLTVTSRSEFPRDANQTSKLTLEFIEEDVYEATYQQLLDRLRNPQSLVIELERDPMTNKIFRDPAEAMETVDMFCEGSEWRQRKAVAALEDAEADA